MPKKADGNPAGIEFVGASTTSAGLAERYRALDFTPAQIESARQDFLKYNSNMKDAGELRICHDEILNRNHDECYKFAAVAQHGAKHSATSHFAAKTTVQYLSLSYCGLCYVFELTNSYILDNQRNVCCMTNPRYARLQQLACTHTSTLSDCQSPNFLRDWCAAFDCHGYFLATYQKSGMTADYFCVDITKPNAVGEQQRWSYKVCAGKSVVVAGNTQC